MKLNKLSVTTACALVISGCGGGGGSSDSSDSPTINTGVFLDSAVEGLAYSTDTQEGSTNAAGEFDYIEGEQVTFKIGDISLPPVSAQETITPLTVFDTTDVTDTGVSNLSRLLQSLDEDGDATNGISFADGLQSASAGTTLDFTDADFANNAAVINLVANSGSSTTALIDAASAQAHLQTTLDTLVSGGATGVETLIAGSPWYSIRVYNSGGGSCGNKYTYNQDGTAEGSFIDQGETAVQTISGTYTFTEATNTLELFGVGSGNNIWVMDTLTSVGWVSQRSDYTEYAFPSRDGALAYASVADIGDCSTGLPQ